ncbi:hypothetical protein [Streptomyces sp. cmx-4-25]|uniref:hypothetical protein n=1 Tax=Streptomyces sp. cmx-4-25 TaxID=2790933 RepID=UPI003980D780
MNTAPPARQGRRAPRTTRALPRAAVLALSLSLLGTSAAAAPLLPPTASVGAAVTVPAPGQAADVPAALAAAARSGNRVEALSERSGTTTTWANPDGTLTTELAAGPVRFDRDGAWVPVDTDLTERPDGTVAAKAHPAALTLAGKGGSRAPSLAAARTAPARDLVTLGEGDRQVTLQ